MMPSTAPKYAVSQVVGFIEGKSAILSSRFERLTTRMPPALPGMDNSRKTIEHCLKWCVASSCRSHQKVGMGPIAVPSTWPSRAVAVRCG
jgi:hypothetical protein